MIISIFFSSSRIGEREDKKDGHSCSSQLISRTRLGPSDFELIKVIGIGAFGKVILVRTRQNNQACAMKCISKRLVRKKRSFDSMKAERDIMAKIVHPFIVNLKCAFQTETKLFLVMEFLAGGELFFHLSKQGLLKEDTAKFYMAEIVLALEHLHSLDIIHRDLKPENLLLGSDGHVRLTDFGLAKDMEGGDEGGRLRTICGTSEYMAPEMILKKGYGKAVDWWSLGALLFEMITGYAPFCARSTRDLYRKILNDKISLPTWVSAPCHQIMRGLLERNVNKRLGATKSTMFEVGGVKVLKNHPFFVDIDWKGLLSKSPSPPFIPDLSGGPMDTTNFCSDFLKMPLPRSLSEDVSSSAATSRTCSGRERSIVARDASERDTASLEGDGQKDHFRGFSYIVDDFESSTNGGTVHYDIQRHQPAEMGGGGNVEECGELSLNTKASVQIANGFHVLDGFLVSDNNKNNEAEGHVKLKGKRIRKNKVKKYQNDQKIIEGGGGEKEHHSTLSNLAQGTANEPITELATDMQQKSLMPSLKRLGCSLADLLEKQRLAGENKLMEEDVKTSEVSGGSGRVLSPTRCSHTVDAPTQEPSSSGGTGGNKICTEVDHNLTIKGVQRNSWASMLAASQGKGVALGRKAVDETQHCPQAQAQANHIPLLPDPQPPIAGESSSKLSKSSSTTKSTIPVEDEWHVVAMKGKRRHARTPR